MKLARVALFDCVGSTQEFTCYRAGLTSPGDHTCGWTTSTLHSHLAWRYWFRWGCGASSTTSVIADLAGGHILYPRSTGPDHAAMHPLRRDTPDQKGCNAYGSGAPPPTTSTNASIPFRHTQPTASDAATRPRHAHPGSEREELHQLASVTSPPSWCNTTKQHAQSRALPPNTPQPAASDAATRPRNTRTDSAQEPLHPLRRDTPDPSQYTRSEGV